MRSGLVSLAVVTALVAIGRLARADLRVAFGNDVFTDLDPPVDDSGLTNDISVAFWRPRGRYLIGGAVFDRWITEVGGRRRWDQLDVLATVERPWGDRVVVGVRLGPTFSGNLGGRWTQNGWHHLTGNWTLDDGLQNTYPGGRGIGALAGGRIRGEVGAPVAGYAGLDGQLAVGTGVSYVEAAGGIAVTRSVRCVELGGHAEVAAARYRAGNVNLTLPGGYGTDAWEPQWRIGVHVEWSRFRLEYEYRANEGGSGEPIGIVAFTVRQHARAW